LIPFVRYALTADIRLSNIELGYCEIYSDHMSTYILVRKVISVPIHMDDVSVNLKVKMFHKTERKILWITR